MSLQFIIGGSGTGKTTYMYDQMIRQSMEPEHEPIIYILPEQSNMAAEQEMVLRHPKGGTMDISILSFTRLSFMVFDELGMKTNDILDDYGKNMMLRKVLLSVNDQLLFYRDCGNKPGFVEEIKSMISEFYQYQIQGSVMERILNALHHDTSLYYKMKDLQLIMNAFSMALEKEYMVAEQVLGLLKEVVGDSLILKNASVYFDGFSGFTPIQYGVIEELLKIGCHLYISISLDEGTIENNHYGDNELFSLCKKEYIKLCYLASQHQITVLPHVSLATNYRLQNRPSLYHLEQHLFRFPIVSYDGEVDGIYGVAVSTVEKEIAFVTRTIKYYVLEKGYQYRDFAIITNDMPGTMYDIRRYMEQMEIPCFLDCNVPLEHNPMLEAVWMLFEIYRTDFSYKSVFSFLKIGLLDIPMEDIYQLENYVIKYGVRGYHWWNKAFRGGVKGLKNINRIRTLFMNELSELSSVFLKSEALGREYIEAIYSFMVSHHMAEKLQNQSLVFERENLVWEADIYGQIYKKWLEVLDKTIDILGEEMIERDTLSKILATGISAMKLGVIPSTLDQVVVGDLERTRLQNIKILFVIGMNDGILPKISSDEGILSDRDRKLLQSMDVALAPDGIQNIFMQQYNFYLQVSQADEAVYFSYHKGDAKGAEQKPSYFLKRIFSMFPNLKIMNGEELYQDRVALTKGQMIADFANQMMAAKIQDASIYHMMEKHCRQEFQDIMSGYLYHNQPSFLNKDIIKALYGTNLTCTVSKLESFSRCAFAFFLQYGLRINKREEYKIENTNLGTILHEVMELFFSTIKKDGISLKDLTDEQRNRLVEKMTIDSAKKENETIFESDSRNKHQLDVLIRIAKRSVENLCRHIEKGDMEPAYFEKEFSDDDKLDYIRMALEDDMYMVLKGVVDRVDIKETDDAVYFKVIDYKSGNKDIDFSSVYEGKQLQLTVYMSAMKELLERQFPEKKVVPVGMYYYQFQDKIIDELEDDLIEKRRMENSRLTGLANADDTCRSLMDSMTGEVSPVRYKQNGELATNNNSLVSTEELQQISDFVRNKMIDIGEEIIHGQINMNPEKGEHACPCNYCDYKSICRFEPGLGGNHYRVEAKLDEKIARDKIMNERKEAVGDEMDHGSAENN